MQKITKEEIQIGIKEISEKCNIDKSKIIYNWEHNGLMIDDVKFEIFPSHLLFVHFNYNILFTNCSFGCFEYFNLDETRTNKLIFCSCNIDNNSVTEKIAIFKTKLHFTNCIFKDSICIGEILLENKLCFLNCDFDKKIYLDIRKCLDTFQMVNFIIKANFKENTYFDNSIFYCSADFSKCEFEKEAYFYGVTFEKAPNFSQAIFKSNVNLVNAKIDCDFKTLKEDLESLCKISSHTTAKQNIWHKIKNRFCSENHNDNTDIQKQKTSIDLEKLAQKANDFRDSFRLFKNALIKENNLLDAANHHRIELYCKEIELESKKPKIFSRDWIDKWILKFYRHTSDHHTDLLKIWHSLLIVVGIFGILSSGVIVAFDYGYLKFCDFSAHSLIEMYNAHINHFVLTHSYQMLGMNALLFMLFIGLFILSVLWDRARVIGICISYCVMIFLFAQAPTNLIK